MTMQHLLFIDETGRSARVDRMVSGEAEAALARLFMGLDSRVDSATGQRQWNTHGVSMRMVKDHLDSAAADLKRLSPQSRGDAFSPSMGMFQPQDLTYRFRQAMEEQLPPLSAAEIYPISTEIDPRAKDYEMHRFYGSGEAVIYNGGDGSDVAPVGVGRAFVTQPIVPIIACMRIGWLDALRAGFAGVDLNVQLTRRVRRVIEEKLNQLEWFGSTAVNLYGITNHPFQDTLYSSTAFDGTSTGVNILAAFANAAWYAWSNKRTVFKPDTVTFSAKVWAYVSQTYADPGSGNPETILDAMKRMVPHVTNWKVAHELDDAGSGGEHGIHFSRRGTGPDTSLRLERPMPPTLLPPENKALNSTTFMVAMSGGANQIEVGHNLMLWVDGAY